MVFSAAVAASSLSASVEVPATSTTVELRRLAATSSMEPSSVRTSTAKRRAAV